jgi:RecA-family ATPase
MTWRGDDRMDQKLPPLDVVDPITLQGQRIPERRWLVPDWFPLRNVSLLSGDGGLGKTQLAQQLATACATGRPWLGLNVMRCKAMIVACEDEVDELHRRQEAINRHLGVEFADLEDVQWAPRVGLSNSLASFDSSGRAEATNFLGQLVHQAVGFGAQLIVLDSLHDFYEGREIDRVQVAAFVSLLRELAVEADAAVIVTAHPSMAGRASGSGEAGSTAWHNKVRARAYLRRPEEAEPDERVLSRRKSNYGPLDGEIRLRWRAGVFVADAEATGLLGAIKRRSAEEAFLACLVELTRQGRRVNPIRNQASFAPKVMATMRAAEGYRVRELEQAMERLLAARRVVVVRDGPPSRPRAYLAIPEPERKDDEDA